MTFNLQPSLSSYPYEDDPTKTVVRLEVFNRGENGFVPLTRIFSREFLWDYDTRFIPKESLNGVVVSLLATLAVVCCPTFELTDEGCRNLLRYKIEPLPLMA